MKIKNAAHWCRLSRPVCYLIAAAVFIAVFGLRWVLHPALGKFYPYQFFFLSSYVVTFFLGAGPGKILAHNTKRKKGKRTLCSLPP